MSLKFNICRIFTFSFQYELSWQFPRYDIQYIIIIANIINHKSHTMLVREIALPSVSAITAVNDCCIDRRGCNRERTRNTNDERRRWQFYTRAELVSRQCTLIRLLCTVIGYNIKFFTRLAEQMEANRGRRFLYGVLSRGASISGSTTSFSLANKHPLGENPECFVWFSIK